MATFAERRALIVRADRDDDHNLYPSGKFASINDLHFGRDDVKGFFTHHHDL